MLDEEYYREAGLSPEQATEQRDWVLTDMDPEALPLDEDSMQQQQRLQQEERAVLSEEMQRRIQGLQEYGPPVGRHAAAALRRCESRLCCNRLLLQFACMCLAVHAKLTM